VHVLDDGVGAEIAGLGSHRDDRQFARERHERFEDQRHATDGVPRRVEVGRPAQHGLSLAVVTAGARLENRGVTDVRDRAVEAVTVVDGDELRGRDAERPERRLLDEAVLRHFQRTIAGPDRRAPRRPTRGGRRHAFPLVGHDGGAGGEPVDEVVVGERAGEQRAERARARVCCRVEEPKGHAQWCAGERQHATELPTAQDTDDRVTAHEAERTGR
jgi:hypothetical protein